MSEYTSTLVHKSFTSRKLESYTSICLMSLSWNSNAFFSTW